MGFFSPFFICGGSMEFDNLLEPTLKSMGYELVEVEQLAHGKLLRIFIDKQGGVSIDDCVSALRHIAKHAKDREKYVVSTENRKFSDIYAFFKHCMKSDTRLIKVPSFLKMFLPVCRLFPGEYERIVYGFHHKPTSSEKLQSTGWYPCRPVLDSIEESVKFYSEHGLFEKSARKTGIPKAPNYVKSNFKEHFRLHRNT